MRIRNPIFRITIKLLVILLLPISIDVFVSRTELQSFGYTCIISRLLNPEQTYYYPIDLLESIIYQNMLLVSIITITIPLMYFEYRMRKMTPDASAIPSAVILFSISIALFNGFVSFLESIYTFYWNPHDVEIAFTWSIFVFLVFPILMRETKLLETHMSKDKPKPATSRFKPNKYSILGYILCILVAIGPYSFERSFDGNGSAETVLVSHSIIFIQSTIINRNSWIRCFTHTYLESFTLEISLLISISFCILLLRYFKCNAKKSAAIFIGLFGASLPIIGAIILPEGIFTVPTPFLLVTGLVLLKIIPVVKADEYIWDKIPEQFWYESPKVKSEEGIVFLKVPLGYIFLSRLRILGSKTNASGSAIETKTVTYDDI